MTKRERELAVERILKRWRQLQEDVWNAEDNAVSIAFSSNAGGEPVQSSGISDKTARGAAILETYEEERAWVDCITAAMAWLKEEQPDLQRLLYGHYNMRHLKGYKGAKAASFARSYCNVYHISNSEYKSRRYEALNQVASLAAECGLIKSRMKIKSDLDRKMP